MKDERHEQLNIDTPAADQDSVRRELDELLQTKIDRISEKANTARFEDAFLERAQELEKQKEEYYQRKGDRVRSSETPVRVRKHKGEDEPHNIVYAAASAAAKKISAYRPVGEGMIHRTWRLVRQLRQKRAEMAGKEWYCAERRRAVYAACIDDCWAPALNVWDEIWTSAWSLLCRFGADLWELLLTAADAIITVVYYLGSFFYYIWDIFWDVRYWFEQRKRAVFAVFATLVIIGASSIVLIQSSTAYAYSYHGKVLGVTRSVDDIYKTIDVLGDKLSIATGANVSLDVERDMSFEKVVGFNIEVDSDEDILNTITYMKDLQVEGYAVMLDGEEACVLESESTAKAILSEIQSEFTSSSEGSVLKEVTYDQDVDIQPVLCLLGDVWNRADAKKYLQGSEADGTPAHLTIRSTETATYTETVAFDVEYVSTPMLYEGETAVKTEGVEGTNLIVATVERVNGEEVSRTIVSTTRIKEPVTEVQYRGTKPVPLAQGSGQFQYPMTSYTISSYYGMRWGQMHTGVDFAAPHGSKIYASDGGTVTFAGWKGSYGYLVIINHGGLFETYYAHCSKVLVSVGDNVYKGQNIALVGSTGYSTGPHCHFEIRYNGTPENPLSYL